MILEVITCRCTECDCHREFESINQEDLLNVIQHGRLNSKQVAFAKKRLGISICEQCFTGNHQKV